MFRARKTLAAVALAALTLPAAGQPLNRPADPGPPPSQAAGLPVGDWTVEFANGVVQRCVVLHDGAASVAEPLRTSGGKAAVKDGAMVFTFQDDRIERWTPVGRRFVVEHWFPGSAYPAGKPVLGVAERTQ